MWDFWKMVWQQDVKLIVMVTKIKDKNRSKCHQYYPNKEGDSWFSKDFTVALLKEEGVAPAPKVFFRREFVLTNNVT